MIWTAVTFKVHFSNSLNAPMCIYEILFPHLTHLLKNLNDLQVFR